jgi:HEAT repeat protein
MELRTLRGQLEDPLRDTKTKLEAAQLLLGKNYPQTQETLIAVLQDTANVPGQMAVAEAIAQGGSGNKAFIDPLFAMLTGKEPLVRPVAARALAGVKDDSVLDTMTTVALDGRLANDVRVATIGAMPQLLDKKAVDALVRLIEDNKEPIRAAAADALVKMTNIRAFGTDAAQWKAWWKRNRDRDRKEWLADVADNLARANMELEGENARLRERLSKAMQDLYAATPVSLQDAALVAFLKDPLPDVRLVGLTLTDRRIAAGGLEAPKDLRVQVRLLLGDADEKVRRSAALLIPNLTDADALTLLLERLKTEDSPLVRQALVKALGQFKDAKALPAVIAEIDSKYEQVAASASASLARLASNGLLDATQKAQAAGALIKRYHTIEQGTPTDGAGLREALLTAMGVLGDPSFVPVLQEAAGDRAATVRLAAVGGLTQLGSKESSALLVLLAGDSDRGVRQAAINALGALEPIKNLQLILEHTKVGVEADEGVRQQAWDVVMVALAKADAGTLASVSDSLATRSDGADQRIKVLQLLVAGLKAKGAPELPLQQRVLGEALVKAKRPAEAAPCLADAYAQLARANDPVAPELWLQWIDALLAGDDPASVKAIAEQTDHAQFDKAVAHYMARLGDLTSQKSWLACVGLCENANTVLTGLSQAQRDSVAKTLAQARDQLAITCRTRVAALAPQLSVGDEAGRKAAATEIQAMGASAVKPLCEELRKVAGGDKDNPEAEKAILLVLKQIAPKITTYDPATTPKPDRIKLIDNWLGGNLSINNS